MPKQGLSKKEVLNLKKKFGDNLLPTKEGTSRLSLFLSQFKSPLIYILIFAALVSLYFRELIDFYLIAIVIIIDALMGFYQEYHAEKTLLALKKILKPKAMVIRDGERQEIEVKDLVPGDLVMLGSGDKVPADGILLEGFNILANEAILTGEEEAVSKTPKANQRSLFMGTTILSGNGSMLVQKIGLETEIGKISQSLILIKEEKTPLLIKFEKFSRGLALIVIVVTLLIFLIGVFGYHKNIWEMFKVAVILGVAAIPEGLPIALTIILALGLRRILARNGLVKKLLSIETLGSTSVICTDKTGTLTEGIMRVVKTDFNNPRLAHLALALANNQRTNLEIALLDYVKGQGIIDLGASQDSMPRVYQEPFDSEKKYGLSINLIDQKEIAFLVGAPEIALSFCRLSTIEESKILTKINDWASQGLRIIGAAFKDRGELKEKNNFAWLGLVAIEDPIRPSVTESIALAQRAGIKVKIITGDYRPTAERVAANLGFKIKAENVLESRELELISKDELKKRINQIVLFTRVTPHQKLKIVEALKENGEVVAMTGDGVNDAPALKKADIGVVVGSATEVAKEVGDLILLDNNFKTIVAAVEEGRLIFANIKRVSGYVLSNSFAEITLIFSSLLLGLDTPLTVAQILWIHLICDGPPDIMLSFEPFDPALMTKQPTEIKKEKILDRSMKFLIITISLVVGLLALLYFRYYADQSNLVLARSLAFATIASVSLIYIFSFKNLEKPLIKIKNFWANKYLLGSVIYGFILILAALYLAPLNQILGLQPLNLFQWFLVFLVGLINLLIIEAFKYFSYERDRK